MRMRVETLRARSATLGCDRRAVRLVLCVPDPADELVLTSENSTRQGRTQNLVERPINTRVCALEQLFETPETRSHDSVETTHSATARSTCSPPRFVSRSSPRRRPRFGTAGRTASRAPDMRLRSSFAFEGEASETAFESSSYGDVSRHNVAVGATIPRAGTRRWTRRAWSTLTVSSATS